MTKAVADWRLLRAKYVEGRPVSADGDPNDRVWPTQQQLADEFGIRVTAVQRHSMREGWGPAREAFQDDIDRSRREALAADRVRRAVNIDRRAMLNSEAGLQLVAMRLTRITTDQANLPDAHRGTGISAPELSSLALAARRWIDVRDAVLGRPTLTDPGDTIRSEAEANASLAERLAAHAAAAQHLANGAADNALHALLVDHAPEPEDAPNHT